MGIYRPVSQMSRGIGRPGAQATKVPLNPACGTSFGPGRGRNNNISSNNNSNNSSSSSNNSYTRNLASLQVNKKYTFVSFSKMYEYVLPAWFWWSGLGISCQVFDVPTS